MNIGVANIQNIIFQLKSYLERVHGVAEHGNGQKEGDGQSLSKTKPSTV